MTKDTETMSPYIDLASVRMGGSVMAVSDEYFAPGDNLLLTKAPVFIPDKYVPTGKWMDGWESRRRRSPGHDEALVKLGVPGRIHEIVVDTAHFTGNFPESCKLFGCNRKDNPSAKQLLSESNRWIPLTGQKDLKGDTVHSFPVKQVESFTHILLRIFPDGGVARLRVLGEPTPNWDSLDHSGELVDMAALENGGTAIDCSDMYFGDAKNLLVPGRAKNMAEGWETKRRRGPGHDWATIKLATPGTISRLDIDTLHFRGNSPGTCIVESSNGAGLTVSELRDDKHWKPLLPETQLRPHQSHRFERELSNLGSITHLRLKIFPDGGISRLRAWGRTARSRDLLIGLGKINHADEQTLQTNLANACASKKWAALVMKKRPFASFAEIASTSESAFLNLEERDLLEACAAHPRIGDKTNEKQSAEEQSGVAGAEAETLEALRAKNKEYESKFGFVFLVFASGKSAKQMLGHLNERLANTKENELKNVAQEHMKITALRLEKWLRK